MANEIRINGVTMKKIAISQMVLTSIIILATISMFSCSSKKPTDDQVVTLTKPALESRLNQTVPITYFVNIVNLKKTDGILNKDGSYTADIEFDLIHKYDNKQVNKMGDALSASPEERAIYTAGFWIILNSGSKFNEGDIMAHVPGKVEFIKSENGWKVTSIILPRKF